jgi:hypothetical protein
MGGPGSGNPNAGKGQARNELGQYTIAGTMTLAVGDTIEKFQMAKKEQDALQASLDKTSQSMKTQKDVSKQLQASIDKSSESVKLYEDEQLRAMFVLQSVTAATNQLTGSMYKMISGLEASGTITAEQAAQYQRTVRVVELLTGAMEAMLAVEILLQAMGTSMAPILATMSASMTGYATATWSAVAAQAALLAPWIVLAAKIAAAVAVFIALAMAVVYLVENLDKLKAVGDAIAASFDNAGKSIAGLKSAVSFGSGSDMIAWMQKSGGGMV